MGCNHQKLYMKYKPGFLKKKLGVASSSGGAALTGDGERPRAQQSGGTQRRGRRTANGGHVWMVPWETCMCQASHPGGRLRWPGARIGAWEHLLGPGWHPNKPRREEEGVLGLMGRNQTPSCIYERIFAKKICIVPHHIEFLYTFMKH